MSLPEPCPVGGCEGVRALAGDVAGLRADQRETRAEVTATREELGSLRETAQTTLILLREEKEARQAERDAETATTARRDEILRHACDIAGGFGKGAVTVLTSRPAGIFATACLVMSMTCFAGVAAAAGYGALSYQDGTRTVTVGDGHRANNTEAANGAADTALP